MKPRPLSWHLTKCWMTFLNLWPGHNYTTFSQMLRINFSNFEFFVTITAGVSRRVMLRLNMSSKIWWEGKSWVTSWTFIGFMPKFNHVFFQFAIPVRVSACNNTKGTNFQNIFIDWNCNGIILDSILKHPFVKNTS